MDPTAMMSDGAFMAEIWPFTTNGGDLDLKFGQVLGQFGQTNVGEERDGSGSEALGIGSRKRRDGDDVASNGNANAMSDCDSKRVKTTGSREENNIDSETEAEANSSKAGKKNTKAVDPSKLDYIHVRARRGQATDSHSLAERARREKISERMKILQDLVPGCNKVIGKASVLDEIINYIQSLQHQVEFLSMKLEAVNTRMDPGIERFPSKDFVQQPYDNPDVAFGSQTTRDYGKDSPPEWLHMQLGGGYERSA